MQKRENIPGTPEMALKAQQLKIRAGSDDKAAKELGHPNITGIDINKIRHGKWEQISTGKAIDFCNATGCSLPTEWKANRKKPPPYPATDGKPKPKRKRKKRYSVPTNGMDAALYLLERMDQRELILLRDTLIKETT